jgi:hypothetical protein
VILVYVRKSWRRVQAGDETEARATLGEWAQLPGDDDRLGTYADVVAGIYDNVIVSIYDVTGWTRDPATGRVTFQGHPSKSWSDLIGAPNPGRPWGDRGYARSVQCLDTRDVAELYPRTDPSDNVGGLQRAVIAGFTLTVDPADPLTATVVPAAGGRVLVAPSTAT